MSIRDWFGLKGSSSEAASTAETETVRKIVARLEAIEPDKARFIAAFAYNLSRVAHADLSIDAAETRTMERLVVEVGKLPEEQAVLAVQIAKSQARLFGSTENFLVTREFRELSSEEERLRLLDCLFAVSAADGSISGQEEAQITSIATELGFTRRQMVEVRSRWNDQRAILQRPPDSA
ncbi:MAG: TerB family tellurite resistance protein [Acidobacteriota bacterium]